MALNLKWLQGVKEKEKRESIEKLVNGNRLLLDRLTEILEAEISSLLATSFEEDYKNASWSHKQADRLGQLRAYKKILLLTKGDHANG